MFIGDYGQIIKSPFGKTVLKHQLTKNDERVSVAGHYLDMRVGQHFSTPGCTHRFERRKLGIVLCKHGIATNQLTSTNSYAHAHKEVFFSEKKGMGINKPWDFNPDYGDLPSLKPRGFVIGFRTTHG